MTQVVPVQIRPSVPNSLINKTGIYAGFFFGKLFMPLLWLFLNIVCFYFMPKLAGTVVEKTYRLWSNAVD